MDARPVEYSMAEGAAYADATGAGGYDDTLQLGDAVGCIRMDQADGEADEGFILLCDE
jgi:hypothetical protein